MTNIETLIAINELISDFNIPHGDCCIILNIQGYQLRELLANNIEYFDNSILSLYLNTLIDRYKYNIMSDLFD